MKPFLQMQKQNLSKYLKPPYNKQLALLLIILSCWSTTCISSRSQDNFETSDESEPQNQSSYVGLITHIISVGKTKQVLRTDHRAPWAYLQPNVRSIRKKAGAFI